MNKVGDASNLFAELDFHPTDPYAIEVLPKQVWYVAPHGKIRGWIRRDLIHTTGERVFQVYSHGHDAGGRVWLRTFATIGSAAAFIRQHEGELAALTKKLSPDGWELVDGQLQRRQLGNDEKAPGPHSEE